MSYSAPRVRCIPDPPWNQTHMAEEDRLTRRSSPVSAYIEALDGAVSESLCESRCDCRSGLQGGHGGNPAPLLHRLGATGKRNREPPDIVLDPLQHLRIPASLRCGGRRFRDKRPIDRNCNPNKRRPAVVYMIP
jgi:hypothetical protein